LALQKCYAYSTEKLSTDCRETNMPEKYINYIRKAVEEELKPAWAKKMSQK